MRARRTSPAAWTATAVAAVLAAAPILLLAAWSFARGWYWPALLPREWSGRAWIYVLAGTSGVREALVTSCLIAVTVAVVSVAAAIPAGRALALHRFRGKQVVLLVLLLPVVAPPLASAMGLHGLFLRYGLADSLVGVMLVHLIPAVPYATLMLTGSFARFDPECEAQARTLGAAPVAVWRHVTLPAVAPGIAVAFAFSFLISWSQYLLTLLIGGGRVLTLPLQLVAFQRGGDEAITAALSLLFLAPTGIVILLVSRCLKSVE